MIINLQESLTYTVVRFVIYCNSTLNKTQKLQWLLNAVLLYFNSLNDSGATFSDFRQHFVWHCLPTLPVRTSALTPVVCLSRPLPTSAQLRQHKWNVRPSVDYVVSCKHFIKVYQCPLCIEFLFLDVVGPKTHQTAQKNWKPRVSQGYETYLEQSY